MFLCFTVQEDKGLYLMYVLLMSEAHNNLIFLSLTFNCETL